jgi:hypothetical protein
LGEARTTTRVDLLLRNSRTRVEISERRIRVTRPDFQQLLYCFGPSWEFNRVTFRKLTQGYGCSFEHVRGREGTGHTILATGEMERAREDDLALLREDLVWAESPAGSLVVTHEDGSVVAAHEHWVPFDGGCLYLDARVRNAETETPSNIGIVRFAGTKMRFMGIVLFASGWGDVGAAFFQTRSAFDRTPYNADGPAVIMPEGDMHWTHYDEVAGEYIHCKSRYDWQKRRGGAG